MMIEPAKDGRNAEIVALKNGGATAREIAGKFGISRSRVYQIVAYEKLRHEKEKETADDPTFNALKDAARLLGCYNANIISRAYNAIGRSTCQLSDFTLESIVSTRNVGYATARLIKAAKDIQRGVEVKPLTMTEYSRALRAYGESVGKKYEKSAYKTSFFSPRFLSESDLASCPNCDAMFSKSYIRCPKCGAVVGVRADESRPAAR